MARSIVTPAGSTRSNPAPDWMTATGVRSTMRITRVDGGRLSVL
ncbi:hypothetical protein QFZ62_000121 [Clavibacter sp. B3I6]|nr:hypothetical protein [Clavibacter sp. B3I6]MDQ0742813.1 hypothetical protein [Clavibacter sp. B3I6]